MTDWSPSAGCSVTPDSSWWVAKARMARAYRARCARLRGVSDSLAELGWADLRQVAEDARVALAGGCSVCGAPVDRVRVRLVDPDGDPVYGHNTEWRPVRCATCRGWVA